MVDGYVPHSVEVKGLIPRSGYIISGGVRSVPMVVTATSAVCGKETDEFSETSGITTGLVLLYVRDLSGDRAVQQLLRLADVPHFATELADDSHWISYQERIRLFEAAVKVLDDPWCTYTIGTQALRWRLNPSSLLLLQAVGSPQQVYGQVARAVPKFSTTSTMRLLHSGSSYAELRFELHAGYEHSTLDCLYAQGLLSAGPELFNLPPALSRPRPSWNRRSYRRPVCAQPVPSITNHRAAANADERFFGHRQFTHRP